MLSTSRFTYFVAMSRECCQSLRFGHEIDDPLRCTKGRHRPDGKHIPGQRSARRAHGSDERPDRSAQDESSWASYFFDSLLGTISIGKNCVGGADAHRTSKEDRVRSSRKPTSHCSLQEGTRTTYSDSVVSQCATDRPARLSYIDMLPAPAELVHVQTRGARSKFPKPLLLVEDLD